MSMYVVINMLKYIIVSLIILYILILIRLWIHRMFLLNISVQANLSIVERKFKFLRYKV